MDLLPTISSYFPSLSKSEKKVAQLILSSPDEIPKLSINELSLMAGVGESTIIRFSRKIGFSGYQDLKLELAKSQAAIVRASDAEEKTDADLIYDQYQQSLQETREFIQKADLTGAARLIHNTNRIVIFAVGSSGLVGAELANRLKRLGKHVEFIQDGQLQSINAAYMIPGEVCFAISTSGTTPEVIANIELAQSQGWQAIAITNYMGSTVAQISQVALIASAKEYSSDAGSFTAAINQLYVIDALIKELVHLAPEQYHQSRLKANKALMKRI